MSENYSLGADSKLYIADALFTGDQATDVESATLTELDIVRDVTVNEVDAIADATTRASKKFRSNAATISDVTIETEIVFKKGDAQYAKLRTAKTTKAEVGIVALTGPDDEEGNEGPAGNFIVENFNTTQALEDVVKVSVTLRASSFIQIYVVPSAP
jgi:hypothetical protein